MRELLGQAWTLARKDLILEFRTRTALLSAVVFTALVLTVFNFGRDPTAVATIDLAPSILWVTFTFAAMLALNRAFQLELENGAVAVLLFPHTMDECVSRRRVAVSCWPGCCCSVVCTSGRWRSRRSSASRVPRRRSSTCTCPPP